MARKTRKTATATAKKRALTKNDDADQDTPPLKLQREDSENTKLRKAIVAVKDQDAAVPKTIQLDGTLIDQCPGELSIHEDYACMLNQTNIGQNNNKFYLIQVAKWKNSYVCFTRWGRVGEIGQWNVDTKSAAKDGVAAFEKKFKDKTKNDWNKRDNFIPAKGKYTLIEIDDDMEYQDEVDSGVVKTKVGDEICSAPSTLDYRTLIMIKLLFNNEMFLDQMSSMKLDVKKMPLGKLSKSQIVKGLEVLIEIEEALKNKKPESVLMELSSQFYTLVPHNFGRMTPPTMNTTEIVQQKKEVMMTLSDIELTQSLQKTKAEGEILTIHPIDEKYQLLDCKMEHLDRNDKEFKLLEQYAKACKKTRNCPLLDIWRVDRSGERERFNTHEDIKHRKLLWHGTNVAVVAAILKAGLRIMPHSGGLVGSGIYFASEYAKSSWYVSAHCGTFEGEEQVGFMFLVEVALGKMHFITSPDSSLRQAPKGYDSIVARGQQEPDSKKDKKVTLDDKEVIVPVGTPVAIKEWKNSNFYQSEYLVYKESQARIRYLLKFSFK